MVIKEQLCFFCHRKLDEHFARDLKRRLTCWPCQVKAMMPKKK